MCSAALVEVLSDTLQVDRYMTYVEDNGAGAIATFTGVTRDTFNGKKVVSLTYEAYVPMAEKEMKVRTIPAIGTGVCSKAWNASLTVRVAWGQAQEICRRAHEKWNLKRMALAHRIGLVGIGEASVIIAVSSAHRKEALEVKRI